MCELLGISSSEPVQPASELAAFRMRGGGSADNPDGWGVAFLANDAMQLLKEPAPAFQSALFAKLSATIRSELIVAHVRKANYPRVNTPANTHPFKEPCCGKDWVFAHNGLVPGVIDENHGHHDAICKPAGQTDSEHAFCRLLSEVAQHFAAAHPNRNESWFRALAKVSEAVASCGKFNFLMSDGEHLLAYGHDRLHYLECRHQRGRRGVAGDVAFVATEPLSPDNSWRTFSAGELRIYRSGRLVVRLETKPRAPASEAGIEAHFALPAA